MVTRSPSSCIPVISTAAGGGFGEIAADFVFAIFLLLNRRFLPGKLGGDQAFQDQRFMEKRALSLKMAERDSAAHTPSAGRALFSPTGVFPQLNQMGGEKRSGPGWSPN